MVGREVIGFLLIFVFGQIYGQVLRWTSIPPVQWEIEENTIPNSILQVGDSGIACVDETGAMMDIEVDSTDIVTLVKWDINLFIFYTLQLNVKLDFEDKDSQQNRRRLEFTCTHTEATTIKILLEVNLVVIDNNDNAPEFVREGGLGQFYSTSVNENTRVGETLDVDIQVRDIDGPKNSRVMPLCVRPVNPDDTDTCEMFAVSAFKAAGQTNYRFFITTKRDHYLIPASSTYLMVIKARDLPESADERHNESPTHNVVIRVIDLQNLSPAIGLDALSFSIFENVDVGFSLTDMSAYDQDEGDPNNIRFVLEPNEDREGYDGGYFVMSETVLDVTTDKEVWKAHLILNHTVDRDSLLSPSKTLLYDIVAVEYPPDPLMDLVIRNPMNTTKTIEIRILDVNDEKPTFNMDKYEIIVSERSAITNEFRQISNEIIIQVTDKDGDQYNDFYVSIVSGNSENHFMLDKNTGKGLQNFLLFVNDSVLDYEIPENRFHELQLYAYDTNDQTMSSRATLTVRVTAQNDNRPQFNVSEYQFNVAEDKTPGWLIGTVFATDADAGDIVTYSIQDLQDLSLSMFAINNITGQIRLIKPVDFETQPTYVLIVRATDDAEPKKFTQINIQIEVLDMQDLGPQFQGSYSAFLNEESLQLIPNIRVYAIDLEDMYTIRYSIANVDPVELTNAFTVSASGALTVNRFIDYKETNNGRIELNVTAWAGSLPTSIVIPITIVDLNNYKPVFIPEVPDRTYRIELGENRQRGDTVFTMQATDKDGDGPNGEVNFILGEGSKDDFIIGADSGDVILRGKLDIDEFSEYNITVEAQDNGIPPKFETAFLIVKLRDENNKPPYFSPVVYLFIVREDSDLGFEIGQVFAFDPDNDNKIQYSLNYQTFSVEIDGNPITDSQAYLAAQEALEIDPDSGYIRTRRQLSRRLYHQIKFDVTAEDVNIDQTIQSRQLAEASVNIIVLSSSENRIYFKEDTWTYDNIVVTKDRPEISSDTAINNLTIVGLVATDPLGSTISNFKEIAGYDLDDYFRVVERVIQVKKALDYEALPANDKSVSVGVQAISEDGTRTADIIYRFRIIDVNDNLPQFDRLKYVFDDVSELLQYPSKVGVVTAKDADSGSYGEVVFSLGGDGSEDFDLYTETSQQGRNQQTLIVKGQLDYEARHTYSLTLTARDNPGASQPNMQLQNTIPLEIRLRDENNKVPQFTSQEYQFTTVGTSAIGYQVGIVLATDADSGRNGEVSYTITDATNNGSSLFRLTTVHQGRTRVGRITVKSSLENEPDRQQVRLEITARDNGLATTNSNTSIAIITISKGVRDMKPKWVDKLKGTVYVQEHTDIGTLVIQVTAHPYNVSAAIRYRFIESGDPDVVGKFLIDADTGAITVGADLNWEDKNRYTLLILATDTTNSSLTNQFLLHIIVTDIDDNDPLFTACPDLNYARPVIASVPEEEPAGRWVYTAKACDMDGTPFNLVRYEFYFDDHLDNSICSDRVLSDFNLDADTGVIVTARPLDRETKSEYLLCVQAFPRAFTNGRRKRDVIDDVNDKTNHDTVLYVLVQISDMNDNGPTFPVRRITKVILEYPAYTVVSTAEAYDPDLPPNNAIRYSINSITFHISGKQYSAPTAFNINSNDGSLTIGTNDYNDYARGYFTVEVRAEDYFGNNNLTDIQIHRIYVTHKVNQIRVVFNQPAGAEVRRKATDMISELQELEVGVYYEIEKISYHVITVDGESRYDRTDVCMVVVQDETVLASVSAAKRMTAVSEVKRVLNKYGAVDPGPCEPAQSKYPEGWEAYWWVLVAFAVFIFVITCLLIILAVVLYNKYENYMTTKKEYLVPGRM